MSMDLKNIMFIPFYKLQNIKNAYLVVETIKSEKIVTTKRRFMATSKTEGTL